MSSRRPICNLAATGLRNRQSVRLHRLAGGIVGGACFRRRAAVNRIGAYKYPTLDEVQVSLPVLVFSGGLSIAAAIMFGMLPGLRSLPDKTKAEDFGTFRPQLVDI